ncbi:MAG TPA: heme biosynthesis protein HemY [Gammaproteobacteria bacterium]|nr:heme biosynthesis protein HemY [Gammaproteobacteria bacterium]
MNRILYILLLSFLTILGFTMFQQKDIGHLSFSFAGHTFETNLIVFTAAVLSALFALLVLARTINLVKTFVLSLGDRRKARMSEHARSALTQGLIDYSEGRFEQAEKGLLKHVAHSDNPLLVYLNAARAAQQLGAHDRRDEYLRKAHEVAPDADIAIGLTKAELQLAHQQNEQALATLSQLHQLAPNHTYVLTLLANTYRKLQDWDRLKEILPDLKKYGRLSDDSFLDFESQVYKGLMSNLAQQQNGAAALIEFWQKTPAQLQQLPEVIEHYARMLLQLDAAGEAEQVLRQYLDKHWAESTIALYSELDVKVDNRQLEMVESWLKEHPADAHLLLALGKMCFNLSLWGKARNYLEASIAINPMPENYLKLARLLEENMHDLDAAQEYYRQGLHLLAGDYGEQALHKSNHDFDRETPQLTVVRT